MGLPSRMPRDGSMVLSDLIGPTIVVGCEPCGRRGHYSTRRLMERHGDARLNDLLAEIVNCRKAKSRVQDRCKPRFEPFRVGRLLALRGSPCALCS